jgi:hypothetical protein
MRMRWLTRLKRFRRNDSGASMVEFSIVAFFMFLLLGGLIDFGLLFYQLNSATKALYQGARIASVSCPVTDALAAKTAVTGSLVPGDPVPYFKITCTNGSCSEGTFKSGAFNDIIYGRGETTCGTVVAGQLAGMCDMFWRIQPNNVRITYEQTGLGFVGRPGGPVPTITVEIINMTYGYIFLQGLMSLTNFTIPPMKTTATGEDMNSGAACP